ncbi:hypothetical protein EAH68_13470 [Corynebacterium hylobatis]|uniref:Uncharacterized protein n=1 Tax=Corynebacterium hylobatis TaxID=1859290 RepID=A0A430HUX0_9CORY|nr:hypothetical protein [Corynebacterium hylobatis]RSZ61390.1 hypothetical protein EAH68_13470 [Corynebacterium hylobatis]
MSARKKNRRKKTTRAVNTVAESTPVEQTPAEETPPFRTPPANPVFHLLEQSTELLNGYGLGRRENDLTGHLPHTPTADPNFRRRPLTTMLTQVDPDGVPFRERVFIDEGELTRTSVEELKCFITEAADRAGTAEHLSDIVVMLNPGSTITGSLRYTINQTVRDHSFDLDPGFGDAQVEAEVLQGVAPYGYDAFTFYALPSVKPVTIWISSDSDDGLIEALKQENEELPVPEQTEA